MLKKVLILLYCIHFLPVLSNILPLYFLTSWEKATVHNIKCPTYKKTTLVDYNYKLTFSSQLPMTNDEYKHLGYLCSLQRWVTKCSVDWKFQREITTYIEYHPINETLCKEHVRLFKDGSYTTPYQPIASCSWLSTSETTLSFTVIKEYYVNIDYYSQSYVNNNFLHGHCKDSICRFSTTDMIWITDKKPLSVCNFINITGEIKYNKVFTDGILSSSFFPPITISESCLELYCGQLGLRTKEGFWLSIDDSIIMSNLKQCKSGLEIIVKDSYDFSLNLVTELNYKLSLQNCLKIKNRIIFGEPISHLDLSVFTPYNQGKYLGYKLNNNTLYTALVLFGEANLSSNLSVYATIKNRTIDNPDPSCKDNCTSTNGIYIINSKYYHPDLILNKNLDHLFNINITKVKIIYNHAEVMLHGHHDIDVHNIQLNQSYNFINKASSGLIGFYVETKNIILECIYDCVKILFCVLGGLITFVILNLLKYLLQSYNRN